MCSKICSPTGALNTHFCVNINIQQLMTFWRKLSMIPFHMTWWNAVNIFLKNCYLQKKRKEREKRNAVWIISILGGNCSFFKGNFLNEINALSDVLNINVYQIDMHDGYWIRFAVLHMREKGNYACKELFVLNHTNIFPKKISTMPMTFSLIFMLNPLSL